MQTVILNQYSEPSYAMKESLRALKTNIQFCGDDIKVIMVTSTAPNEGKSTVSFDLARSFTESNKTVLLIDSDMRKSVLVGRLRAKAMHGRLNGLSHYLSGQSKLDDVLYATQLSKLYIIFAGPSVPNPTEILEKSYFEKMIMAARDKFDYIIIDCAPLGAAIDAAVVAKQCDGAIMVVAQGAVGAKDINNSKKQLEVTGVRILGAVLNKVKREKKHYGRYSGYGQYGSYYENYNNENEMESEAEAVMRMSKRGV